MAPIGRKTGGPVNTSSDSLDDAAYRPVSLAAPSVDVGRLADGALILKSTQPLDDYHRQIGIPCADGRRKRLIGYFSPNGTSKVNGAR